MAPVLVLTRRDGTNVEVGIMSPFLLVQFERRFKRIPATDPESMVTDQVWLAFVDQHDRPPADDDELLSWLRQFVSFEATDTEPTEANPTVPVNGQTPAPAVSSPI
jgi:hypothetical protein